VTSGDENALTNAIAIEPVATAVFVDSGFQFYSSGIYASPTCLNVSPEHGIGVVGYGDIGGPKGQYYILKNSWGVAWGLKGYILLARNQGNMCAVATTASYVIV